MGRMLDTLRLGEGRRPALASEKPEPETPAPNCVVEWEIGEEAPYVEVGGPDKKVQLSPGLLPAHPPQTAQPPHAAVREKALSGTGLRVVDLTATKPMAAAFEPWPLETPALTGVSADIVAYHEPEHPASKDYAVLLAKMLAGLKPDQPNVVLLLGLKPQVGVTTVLLNLAVLAAREPNRRVVVVDANGARPALAQRLGRPASAGLEEVFLGTLALEQAIAKTALPSLHLLSAGAPAKKRRPVSAEAMNWLDAWLRERYDLIFIDGPTSEEVGAVAVQAPRADGVYLVLPQGETTPLPKGAAQSISRMGGRLSGLIHTRFDM